MLNFVPTAAAVQLPFSLHLWPSGFREEPCDARFAEGTRGEGETSAVRFRDLQGLLKCRFYVCMYTLGWVRYRYQDEK